VAVLKGSSGDVQHFADRIIAEPGVRYSRVAMILTSAKTKRRLPAYLTIETPVIACAFRVKSAASTAGRSLLVFLLSASVDPATAPSTAQIESRRLRRVTCEL
jgi:hypothetical protein